MVVKLQTEDPRKGSRVDDQSILDFKNPRYEFAVFAIHALINTKQCKLLEDI